VATTDLYSGPFRYDQGNRQINRRKGAVSIGGPSPRIDATFRCPRITGKQTEWLQDTSRRDKPPFFERRTGLARRENRKRRKRHFGLNQTGPYDQKEEENLLTGIRERDGDGGSKFVRMSDAQGRPRIGCGADSTAPGTASLYPVGREPAVHIR